MSTAERHVSILVGSEGALLTVYGVGFLKAESSDRHALWNQAITCLKSLTSATWAGSRPGLGFKHCLLPSNQE